MTIEHDEETPERCIPCQNCSKKFKTTEDMEKHRMDKHIFPLHTKKQKNKKRKKRARSCTKARKNTVIIRRNGPLSDYEGGGGPWKMDTPKYNSDQNP